MNNSIKNSIKNTLALGSVVGLLALSVGSAGAAPFKAADKNPQVVAHYEMGTHGIVGENETHVGADIVMKTGSNGNFQQWFYGTSASEGKHGEHSVWKIKTGETCEVGWDLVVNPYPEWGDHMMQDVDYCVKTNDFNLNY